MTGQPASVNITAHGATGVYGDDATGALLAALDALPPRGGEIVLPPGVYCVSRTTIAKHSFSLRGTSREASMLVLKEPVWPALMIHSEHSQVGLSIRDLTVIHEATPTSSAAIAMRKVKGMLIDNVRMIGFRSAWIIGDVSDGALGACYNVAFRNVKMDPGPDGGVVVDAYNVNGLFLDVMTDVSGRAKSTGIRFAGLGLICDTVDIAALVKDCGTAIRAIASVANVNLSGARLDGVQQVALHLEPAGGAALSSWHALGGLWVSSAGYGVIADASKGSISEIDLRFCKLDSAASPNPVPGGPPVNLAGPLLSLKGLTNSSFAGRFNPSACAPGVTHIERVACAADVDTSGMRAVA